MPKPIHQSVLFTAALKQAERETVRDRIQIYDALAEYAGSPAERENFIGLATNLRNAEQRHLEFTLKFSLKP